MMGGGEKIFFHLDFKKGAQLQIMRVMKFPPLGYFKLYKKSSANGGEMLSISIYFQKEPMGCLSLT